MNTLRTPLVLIAHFRSHIFNHNLSFMRNNVSSYPRHTNGYSIMMSAHIRRPNSAIFTTADGKAVGNKKFVCGEGERALSTSLL